MNAPKALRINLLRRFLTMSLLNAKSVPMVLLAGTIAMAGNMIQPTESHAQLQCLICNQLTDRVNGEWVWIHWFDMDSAADCEVDPGPMCRWCGGESTCHEGPVDDDGDGIPDRVDTDAGECHSQSCMPEFTLNELAREVTTMAANLNARTGPVLAARVVSEPSLMYDASRNAVRLMRCEGTVLREWYLDELASSYLVDLL